MASTIAFPASEARHPSGVLYIESSSCSEGHHHQCQGLARFSDLTIRCSCDCHVNEQAALSAVEQCEADAA